MATLIVSQTTNYSVLALPINTTIIDFTNPIFSSATATFSSNQFDGVPISTAVTIEGSGGFNHIVVNGAALNAIDWNFVSWSSNDTITLNGTTGADVLTGSIQRDTLSGGQDADVLSGGGGRDTINGEAGNDVFDYTSGSYMVGGEQVNGGGGNDTIRLLLPTAYLLETLVIASVERLEFAASALVIASHTQIGSGLIDIIKGHSGFDRLDVMGQSINLTGVNFNLWDESSDILRLVGTDNLTNNIIGSDRRDQIFGGTLADAILGRGGNDSLYGDEGADNMSGGSGDDTFNYEAGAEIVADESVNGGNGLDTIVLVNTGSYSFKLAAITGVEALKFSNLGGTASFDAGQIGSGNIVSVIGSGGGIDTLVVNGSVDLSGVTFSAWSAADSIFIFGGGQTGDNIIGSSFADEIDGDGGDDTIEGGAGFDSLLGGAGDDTVSYAGSALAVSVNLMTNVVSGGDASGDNILSFVNVIGGQGGDTLTGSDVANSVAGGAGDDIIIGGLGADNLQGGGGADTFVYSDGDQLDGIETINGGGGDADTITFDVNVDNSFTFLEANVTGIERLVFTANEVVNFAAGVLGSGPGQIDTVVGSANNNVLTILGANTDLSGVTFSNWLGVFGGDVLRIIGEFDDETIIGSDVTDEIIGLSGSDTIDGGNSADILVGSLGQDFLTGGAGADIFVYEAVNDSATGGSRDHILDFNQGTDTIRLSSIDAKAGGGDNAFIFIEELDFTDGQAGRLRYFHNVQGNTIIEGEVNGDGVADFSIQIDGHVNLAGADFEL